MGLRAATSFVIRLLTPAPADGRSLAVGALLFFALGAAFASAFALSMAGWVGFIAAIAALTALAAVYVLPHPFPRLRSIAAALLIALHGFWLCMLVALASVLAWSVPTWVWVIDALLIGLVVAGAAMPRARFRVPAALPIGIAIATLMGGWMREDGVIRCDDYLRLRAGGMSVLVPSTPELSRCAPGESLMVRRYPRQVWEAPGGERYVITTQRGDHDFSPSSPRGRIVDDWLNGAICEFDIGSGEPPHCLADGKAHGIVDSRRRDRLYVATHGPEHGTIYALPRDRPFRALGEADLQAKVGILYLDDALDILGLFEDDGLHVIRWRASDFAPLDVIAAPFLPDTAHYDETAHEGIACAAIGPVRQIDGNAYAAVAFTGQPFTFRPLAPSSSYPSSWLALTWGCDWDPVARRAYVAIASLGLLEEIDYDDGRILRRSFVGFGVRSVAFDRDRRRLYAAYFLSGDVIAIDIASGAVVERWPAGRFVRQIKLTRDGNALLVTSNMGLVRVPLAAPST